MSADRVGSPQQRALAYVAALSSGPAVDPALRVTLNFHPDRLAGDRTTLASLAKDGVYYSQFVTGTSNGGLTAHPGGDRWRWESRIFGGAYDQAPGPERPVYGSLNFRHRPYGGSPRFGSAHFRLTGEVLGRTTFCYPDSVAEPSDFGIAAHMPLIELAEVGTASGTVDALDDYIEAHVHGPVHLEQDVEALVLDPSYHGTEVDIAAALLPCPVEWHAGFRLSVEELRRHPDYRGEEFVELGARIAVDGFLDPRIIGDAARTGEYDEQVLKRVWHYVARFGASAGQRINLGGVSAKL